MAQAVITKKGREKLCKAHAGDIKLPKITHMALGNGGITGDGSEISVYEPTGEEEALLDQKIVKELVGHMYPESTTCRYTARLEKEELANEYISEQGLIDEEGDLVAYKAFMPKGKDIDMVFIFDMDEIF